MSAARSRTGAAGSLIVPLVYNLWSLLQVALTTAIVSEKAKAKAKTSTLATRPEKCQVMNL